MLSGKDITEKKTKWLDLLSIAIINYTCYSYLSCTGKDNTGRHHKQKTARTYNMHICMVDRGYYLLEDGSANLKERIQRIFITKIVRRRRSEG